jgi:RNA polymerase sigma factor (sigma-70 family)
VVVALTAKKIAELTPVIRHLARQFEQAGKRVALDPEDLEQEGWVVARKALANKPDNERGYVSFAVRNHFLRITRCRIPTEELNGHDVADDRQESENVQLETLIGSSLLELSTRQQRVVRLYFGIGCKQHSMREVAAVVSLGRGTVEREIKAAVAVLGRSPLLIGEWQQVFLRASP